MKIPGIIFMLLIICFANIQSQTLKIFDPPSWNWVYYSPDLAIKKKFNASVSQLNNSKMVFGIIDSSNGSLKSWYTQSIPYYFKLNNTAQPVVHYTDSVKTWFNYLSSADPEFTNLFSPDQNDNLFIVSGYFEVGKIPNLPNTPTAYYKFYINLIKESGGSISRIAHWDSTAHPSIVRDETGRIHIMWEEITPLNNNKYYTSKIYYNTITDDVFGGKVLIGKGFYPEIKMGNDGKIHALWYEGDTMSVSTTYKAKHCTIESGVISSIDSIYDFHELYGSTNSSYSTIRFLPPIKWSVSKSGELQMVWIEKESGKIVTGRFFKGKGLEIVKSREYVKYDSYEDAYKYLKPFFKDDGEITIAWTANQKLYSASSGTNDIFNNISELPIPADVFPAGASFVPVMDTSGAFVYFFLYYNNNFVLKSFPGNSSFKKILKDYNISPGLFIDKQNTVWCVSISVKPTVISFSLNDPLLYLDETTGGQIPGKYALSQNYPNPFNPDTKITYSIPKSQNVKLTVYNILGKEVATLVNEFNKAGNYTVQFNGSSLPSGVYIYTIQAGQYMDSKKLVILK